MMGAVIAAHASAFAAIRRCRRPAPTRPPGGRQVVARGGSIAGPHGALPKVGRERGAIPWLDWTLSGVEDMDELIKSVAAAEQQVQHIGARIGEALGAITEIADDIVERQVELNLLETKLDRLLHQDRELDEGFRLLRQAFEFEGADAGAWRMNGRTLVDELPTGDDQPAADGGLDDPGSAGRSRRRRFRSIFTGVRWPP